MKAITNKSNPAVVADFSSPLVSKGEVKGVLLRPSVPWRRPASDRESDVKLSGSVMKRDTDQFPVAAWYHPCVATRASERIALYPPLYKGRFRGVPEAKDRVGARESGRRRPSIATRARLQREAVESSTMEGGETPSFTPSSGPVVWRHGQRLVWVASRESTNSKRRCPPQPHVPSSAGRPQ